ncbi:UNVERIFIED_CONTAM: hypothetical protein PYX00_007434 [Menopon gallinae]|uniref:Uncharacterized protein n=1 Tax=Menopon gallinae TaxID=328185 RepID=A0AAW2HJ31_9NEOP
MASGLLNGHNGVDHLENEENGVDVEKGEENCVSLSGNMNGVDVRIKKKAKRLMKQFSKDSITNGMGASVIVPPRSWKNTRRPRNGYGRGLPKKGKQCTNNFTEV